MIHCSSHPSASIWVAFLLMPFLFLSLAHTATTRERKSKEKTGMLKCLFCFLIDRLSAGFKSRFQCGTRASRAQEQQRSRKGTHQRNRKPVDEFTDRPTRLRNGIKRNSQTLSDSMPTHICSYNPGPHTHTNERRGMISLFHSSINHSSTLLLLAYGAPETRKKKQKPKPLHDPIY